MKIDKETIEKVAEVARIQLTDKELNKFSKDLDDILKAFDILKKIDTSKEKPTFQPIEVKNILREDLIEECLPQKKVLEMTENKEGKFIKGPRVI